MARKKSDASPGGGRETQGSPPEAASAAPGAVPGDGGGGAAPVDVAGHTALQVSLNLPVSLPTGAGPVEIRRHAVGLWDVALVEINAMGLKADMVRTAWREDATTDEERATEIASMMLNFQPFKKQLLRVIRLALAPKMKSEQEYSHFMEAGDERTTADVVFFGMMPDDYGRILTTFMLMHHPVALLKNVSGLGQTAKALLEALNRLGSESEAVSPSPGPAPSSASSGLPEGGRSNT